MKKKIWKLLTVSALAAAMICGCGKMVSENAGGC